MLLVGGAGPHIFAVAQGGVEHAATALEVFAPGHRIIAGQVVLRVLVEGQQPVHAIAVELLELVDLVVHRPRVAQVLVGGVRRVLVGHVDGDLRAVGQEQPAQHAVKRRKPMERVAA